MQAEERCTVRAARPTDVERMVGLLDQLFALEADFRPDPARQQQGLALLLDDERARVLVAERADGVVGMCTGQLVVSTAEGGPALLVEDVVVDPHHRGRGIGRALLAALADWASGRGVRRLQLLADGNNGPALAFYDRLGWQATALVCRRLTL
jgi:ribosomal protein S18 acetylase RimI-like enzyme